MRLQPSVIEWHDDVSRKVHTYAIDGTELGLPRDYTLEENEEADRAAALATVGAEREATRAAVQLIITDLKLEKDRMDPVLAKTPAQITGGDTKDVARAAKRIADAAIELARFVQDM